MVIGSGWEYASLFVLHFVEEEGLDFVLLALELDLLPNRAGLDGFAK